MFPIGPAQIVWDRKVLKMGGWPDRRTGSNEIQRAGRLSGFQANQVLYGIKISSCLRL